MTAQEYIRILRERWQIVATVMVAAVIVSLAVFVVTPTQYRASVSLYVSAQFADNPQLAYQGAQLSEQRVKSYTQLVSSERVAAETIRRLNLDQSPGELASKVSASSPSDSVIITIQVAQQSPQQAADVANTVGAVVSEVVAQLEQPAAPGGVAPVAVRTVQPASPPSVPSSTSLSVTILLGMIAGLGLGVISAFTRNSLDNSVKSPEVLSEAVGTPTLGTIAFNSKAASEPLITYYEPNGSQAESFRQVRTNLQFADVDNQRKAIAVTSSVPDEGKTTTVANLAISLASTDLRVLVIDADLRRPRLSQLLGIDPAVGLTHVLSRKIHLSDAIQTWTNGSVDVLGSGPTPPNPSELLGSQQMAKLLEEARTRYDLILIDTPPLLPVTDTATLAAAVDGVVVVCRYKKTKKSQLVAAKRALNAVSVAPLGAILTMTPDKAPSIYSKYYQSGAISGGSYAAGNNRRKSTQAEAYPQVSTSVPGNLADDAERTRRIRRQV